MSPNPLSSEELTEHKKMLVRQRKELDDFLNFLPSHLKNDEDIASQIRRRIDQGQYGIYDFIMTGDTLREKGKFKIAYELYVVVTSYDKMMGKRIDESGYRERIFSIPDHEKYKYILDRYNEEGSNERTAWIYNEEIKSPYNNICSKCGKKLEPDWKNCPWC